MHYNFLKFERLQGTNIKCIKPILFKIDDIDLKGRFVNLFAEFSPLCSVALGGLPWLGAFLSLASLLHIE